MAKLIFGTCTADSLKKEFKEKGIKPEKLQETVVKTLISKGKKLATAESCTGGLISKRITDVPGASAVFDCGVCSYANRIKMNILGVKEETLKKYGAVSAQRAAEMAQGAAKISGADIGVSTTGIAGPDGGTAEKPVGLVYIGIYTEGKKYAVKAFLDKNGSAGRDKVRERASNVALYRVLTELTGQM